MVYGGRVFTISLNDTDYKTNDFTRASEHLDTILFMLGLLNLEVVSRALMTKIFFECDTIVLTIGDDTLTIRKTNGKH